MPIHPRNDLFPLLLIVFQVTNNGWLPEEGLDRNIFVRLFGRLPKENIEVLEEFLELSDEASAREEAVDRVEGVEDAEAGLGARRRLIAAGRGGPDSVDPSSISTSPSSSCAMLASSLSVRLSSSVSNAELYLSHNASVFDRLCGCRLSRLADKLSKQYAQ